MLKRAQFSGSADVDARAAELELARACAAGDSAAIAALEKTYFPDVRRSLAIAGRAAAFVSEVEQALRLKLFVAERDARPKIGDYSGRGPLQAWLRVVALRTAQDLLRATAREVPFENDALIALAEAKAPLADPAVQHLKAKYKGAFEEAVREAVRELAPRDQNALRLHYLDGVSMDQIAALHRVHRITVVRWIGAARRELLERTRHLLRNRLGITEEELDSIMRLIDSELDVSLTTAFDS